MYNFLCNPGSTFSPPGSDPGSAYSSPRSDPGEGLTAGFHLGGASNLPSSLGGATSLPSSPSSLIDELLSGAGSPQGFDSAADSGRQYYR